MAKAQEFLLKKNVVARVRKINTDRFGYIVSQLSPGDELKRKLASLTKPVYLEMKIDLICSFQ